MSEDAAPKKKRPIEIYAEAEPIKLGAMLWTLVEPHRGHEVDAPGDVPRESAKDNRTILLLSLIHI